MSDNKIPTEIVPLVTSVNGACRALDVGRDRLYDMINGGLIESFLDGDRRKIVIASIERYIAERVKNSKKIERRRHPVRGPDGTVVQLETSTRSLAGD